RQASASGFAQSVATQIASHQAHQRALPIQPLRDRLQLAADLVPGKDLEYSGLDGAFLTHCRLRRRGWRFRFNGLHPQPTRTCRALSVLKFQISTGIQKLSVYGPALDYEGEIAIVLGKRGVDLKPSQLKDYVWGVTMLADWSI